MTEEARATEEQGYDFMPDYEDLDRRQLNGQHPNATSARDWALIAASILIPAAAALMLLALA